LRFKHGKDIILDYHGSNVRCYHLIVDLLLDVWWLAHSWFLLWEQAWGVSSCSLVLSRAHYSIIIGKLSGLNSSMHSTLTSFHLGNIIISGSDNCSNPCRLTFSCWLDSEWVLRWWLVFTVAIRSHWIWYLWHSSSPYSTSVVHVVNKYLRSLDSLSVLIDEVVHVKIWIWVIVHWIQLKGPIEISTSKYFGLLRIYFPIYVWKHTLSAKGIVWRFTIHLPLSSLWKVSMTLCIGSHSPLSSFLSQW